MRAVVLRDYGPPAQLGVEDVAPPQLKPGQVRLRVHAVGFGFPDALTVAGKYQVKPEVPFTPGSEVAGVVTEVAPDVTHVKPGARVLAMAGQGGLAEECVAAAASLIALPPSMTMAAAAGFLVNYGTTYHALVQRANLKPGETLLVLGAAGGVGLTAIEIGKALGARVLAGASTDEKLALAKQHGADAVFNYTTEPIKAKVMEFTRDRGIDVIYDPVGGEVFDLSTKCIAFAGRLLVIGFASGTIPTIQVNRVLLKNISIVGLHWGAYRQHDPAKIPQAMNELFALYARGAVTPLVASTYPLHEAAAALDEIASRRSVGKVLLIPS